MSRQEQKSYLQGNQRPTVNAQNGMAVVVVDKAQPSSAGAVLTENGTPQQITLRDGPDCANVLYEQAQPLGLLAYVEPTGVGQTNNLFSSKIVGVGAPPVPAGGLVPVGRLIVGHMGVSKSLLFNIDPGSMAKAIFLASSARFGLSVYPRYFIADDTTSTRKYIVGNPGAVPLVELTNEMWNTPRGNGLVSTALKWAADHDPNYAQLKTRLFNDNLRAVGMGHFGYGGSASAGVGRIKRVFYGTLKPGTAYATRTRCPIAFNATSVVLVGGAGGMGAGAVSRVQMVQQMDPAITDPAINDLTMGPQDANIEVPLTATGWIYVTSPDDTHALAQEIPFELHYYIGL